MEYHSRIKRNKALIHAKMQMNLELIMRNGRSQAHKATCCTIPFTSYMTCQEKAHLERQKVGWWLLGTGGRDARIGGNRYRVGSLWVMKML